MSTIGKVGDLFQLSKECYGLVVASSIDKFCLEVYSSEIWKNLDAGILLMTNEIGLVHYPFDDEEMRFVSHHRSNMNKGMSKAEVEALLKSVLSDHSLN